MGHPWTPGPWFIDKAGDIRAGEQRLFRTVLDLPDDTSFANARLIAAAPAMAEALETTREDIMEWVDMGWISTRRSDAAIARIDAALASAKGTAQGETR